MPNDPLTKVQHQWVAIEITPVDVYRRQDGEVVSLRDPDAETQVQIGCSICNLTPEKGWHTVCKGEE